MEHDIPFTTISNGITQKEKLPTEKSSPKRLLIVSIIVYLSSSYLMMIISNYVSSKSPYGMKTLPDIGLSVVPAVNLLWLTDFFVNLPVLLTFAHIIFYDSNPILSTCRIGHVLSALNLLRCITVLSTGMPDPRPSCERITQHYFTTLTVHRCGDCIFSGHMAVLTTFLMHWICHAQRNQTIYRLTWACFWAEIWAILANRTHYTVDIVLAIALAISMYLTHCHIWKEHFTHRYPALDESKYRS